MLLFKRAEPAYRYIFCSGILPPVINFIKDQYPVKWGDRLKGIGQKLKKLRGYRYTQKEVSQATGIPASTIAAYEINIRQPSLDNLRVLANFYEVSPGYLLGDEASPTSAIPSELWEIFQEVTQRPHLKLLFKEGQKLTEDEILVICQLIATIKKKPEG